MTFYRKYRPQIFAEVLGQPQVTDGLARALAAGQPAHAYLFAGPRGTGKTSVARIVAKSLNCLDKKPHSAEPCNHCANCQAIDKGAFLDVVEIDAASHNGVESIRDLIEQVQTVPALGQYKVYILDEVHMLSTAAFNALLKTLEEPPTQVVFILCTTESHKVPVTIASRCQRFSFSRATIDQLVQQLHQVVEAEKITIEDSALELIAELAEGGYRDAEVLLEQVATGQSQSAEKITRQMLQQRLGLADQQTVNQLLNDLVDQQSGQLIQHLENFASQGGHMRQLADALLDQCRLLLLISVDMALGQDAGAETLAHVATLLPKINQTQLLAIIQALLEARQKLQHFQGSHLSLVLETSLLEALQPSTTNLEAKNPGIQSSTDPIAPKTISNSPNTPTIPTSPIQPVKGDSKQSSKVISQHSQPIQGPTNPIATKASSAASASQQPTPTKPIASAELTALWPQILDIIRPQSRSVEALLRDCVPLSFDGTILVLQFWYAFHKNKLELDKNRKMVEDAAIQLVGHTVTIQCQLGDKNNRPKKRPMGEEDIHNVAGVEEADLLDAAVDIFGGEIVE
jgi:DNA polymerase-3 subunit gamma/tau